MEKKVNWKEIGLWIVKDYDGYYLCNRKPYKNYHDMNDFVWGCEGDFIKIDNLENHDMNFLNNMNYADDPIKVIIVPYDTIFEKEDSDNEN